MIIKDFYSSLLLEALCLKKIIENNHLTVFLLLMRRTDLVDLCIKAFE